MQVNFEPNGAVLDAAKCQIYINGKLQQLSSPPNVQYLSPATPTLNFSLKNTYSNGKYEFKAVMVTTKGGKSEYSWTYSSKGAAGAGGLIDFNVITDPHWLRFIARGAIVTVELTVSRSSSPASSRSSALWAASPRR